MKKRYIAIVCAAIIILMSCGPLTSALPWLSPVRPFIQLPGERFPNLAIDLRNTFMASLLAYIIVIAIALSLRASTRTADEVPSGFYNFFEMVLEFAYNFASNIAGEKKVKDFFPFFMTYIFFLVIANTLGLMPGFDSIGVWEYKPHFFGEQDIAAIEAELDEIAASDESGVALSGELASLEEEFKVEHTLVYENGDLTEESHEELLHAIEKKIDADNKGDLRVGPLLIRKDFADAAVDIGLLHPEEGEDGEKIGYNPEAADWTIVPFFRPASTDLNLTLALALVAMIAVQYFGFKYLGVRGYLSKFFPFIAPGWKDKVAKNPVEGIFPIVGLLELISEFSKIISFAFRLLGNIFAGMVLLFVMAFLLPAANIAFFHLELFVGLIQAMVFGLLMLIFMVGATDDHHGDDHH